MAGVDKHWVCNNPTGDWSLSANWSLTRGGAGGAAVPTTDDDVFVELGTQPMTNLAGITADLGSLTWSADYPLGTASTPISITVSGDSAYANRDGVVRISKTTFVNLQAAAATGIDKLSIETPSNSTVNLSVTSTGGFAANSGDYVHIAGGTVTIDGECAAAAGTVLRVVGGNVTANADSNAFRKTITAPGAKFTSRRSIVTCETEPNAETTTDGAAAITTEMIVHAGGTHRHTAYGTIALSDVRPGGKATAANSKYSFTLTARTKWAGADNFSDASRITNVPTDTGVGETGPG